MSSTLLESALNLVFPPTCCGCGERIETPKIEVFVCATCADKIKLLGQSICSRCGSASAEGPVSQCAKCPHFETCYSFSRSACSYTSPIRELIHEFKFQGSRRVRPFLYEIFLKGADRFLNPRDFDAIVPIPLHWWRGFRREYNQAELLADALGKVWNIPVLPKAAKRVRMTLPQSQIPGRYRERNIQGAFSPGPESVTGMRVLLVDDVMTTGQTLAGCSVALFQAGAKRVVGYTLARRG